MTDVCIFMAHFTSTVELTDEFRQTQSIYIIMLLECSVIYHKNSSETYYENEREIKLYSLI